MGQASVRLSRFLRDNPACIYCGEAATTEDHCPLRGLFIGKHAPVDYSFGCCERCNQSSKHAEAITAFVLRLGGDGGDASAYAQFDRQRLSFRSRYPAEYRAMFESQARTAQLMPRGGQFASRQVYDQGHIVTMPPLVLQSVITFAAKLGKALHFKHTGNIVAAADIRVAWATNSSTARPFELFEQIMSQLGGATTLTRNGRELSDQFDYRYGIGPSASFSAFAVRFGELLGLYIVVGTQPGFHDGMDRRISERLDVPEQPMRSAVFPQ